MGHRLGQRQRSLHSGSGLGQGCTAKIAVEPAEVPGLGLLEQPFRSEIAGRRIVLVQRVHGHTLGRRAGGLGQARAKLVVRLVGNTQPVDGAQHDGFRLAKQHDAPATQCHRVQPHHRVVSHHVAKRRRGVDVERGHAQRLIRRSEHPERARKQNRHRKPDGIWNTHGSSLALLVLGRRGPVADQNAGDRLPG